MHQFICRLKNPIRKMAILGVSGFLRMWYSAAKSGIWPKNTTFFEDYEEAKDELIDERFQAALIAGEEQPRFLYNCHLDIGELIYTVLKEEKQSVQAEAARLVTVKGHPS